MLGEGVLGLSQSPQEGVLGLNQSTLGGSFWPEPEYSRRELWALARVLWEELLGLSQSTLGGSFGPDTLIENWVAADAYSTKHNSNKA